MNMQLVDAVNICLRAVGESPVPSADSLNPYAAAALDLIETTNRTFQARGWYFNTQQNVRLVPNTDGNILLPANTVSINTDDTVGGYSIRGNRLYDLANNTDKFSHQITLDIIEHLKYEDLPYTAANHVAYQAALEMQVTYETEPTKIQVYAQMAERASIEMKRDHYRNRNLNSVNRHALGNMTRGAGVRGLLVR